MAFVGVARSLEEGEATLRIVYRHSGAPADDPTLRVVDELSVRELAERVGFSPAEAERLCDRRKAVVLCNGWQSWSPGWELMPEERMPRLRFKKKVLSLFLERPQDLSPRSRRMWAGPLGRRADLRSHFFLVIRSGDLRLAFVSRNAASAPLGLSLRRASMSLRVDVASDRASRQSGDLLADMSVVAARDWFTLKEAFAGMFEPARRFARLSFLSSRSSPVFRAGGWESWYHHYTDIDQALIVSNLEALPANPNVVNLSLLKKGRPVVFQVDDGWEVMVGDWEPSKERFPSGMAAIAERIKAKGLIPGLWIAPFVVTAVSRVYHERPEWILRDRRGRPVRVGWNPSWEGDFFALDLSMPDVRAYLDKLFDRIINDWGFRFLKLDFLYAGFFPGKRAVPGPAWKWYDDTVRILTAREKSRGGEPVAYLGCGAPLEASWERFPLMRIGADTKEDWEHPTGKIAAYAGRPAAYTSLKDSIGRALLNGTVFASDPDVFFLRSDSCTLTRTERELVALTDFLFGSLSMVSDDLQAFPEGEDPAFTARIVSFFEKLEALEVAVEALQRDLYRVWSRCGRLEGVINLRDKPWRPGGLWNPGSRPALVEHLHGDRRSIAYERRSISLYLREPDS